ncbi:MAG: DUF4906 domain-containing protein [Bacteroides sp.]|jgi:hypothetical protein|nr:DUF4906 domain-containing protein [Bacteroides sp.]
MRLKNLAYLGICTVIFAACSDEQTDVSTTEGKEVEVLLNFKVTEMQEAGSSSRSCGEVVLNLGGGDVSSSISNPVDTRSYDASGIDDATVSNLWIFQYVNGTFVRKQYFSKVDMSDFNVDLSSNASGQTSNLYFIANVGANAFPNLLATEDAFKANSLEVTDESSLFPSSGYMPMSGSLTKLSIPDDLKGDKTVMLTSMLAQIDLSYTLGTNMLSEFSLKCVRLMNVPDCSYPYVTLDATDFPTMGEAKVQTFDYEVISGNSMTFYLPDNRRGDGNNEEGKASGKSGIANATCIQLIGYLNGDEIIYNLYPGQDEINNYDIVRNTRYTVKANITGTSEADKRVKKTSLANAYMVKPGGFLHIPVKRANQSGLGVQLANLDEGWTSEVIWRDNNALTVTTDEALKSVGFFEVKVTDAAAVGNALVCVKNDEGKVLWSWHIWVTDYDPETDNEVYNNYTWMDRNLGAVNDTPGDVGSLGLLYQWGRKDPFVGANATTVGNATLRTLYSGGSGSVEYNTNSSVSTDPANTSVAPTDAANNLANAIQHPGVFYYKGASSYDWYCGNSTIQDNTLWDASNKTVYDPCPAGWKVPANEAFSTWSTSTVTWNVTYLGCTINDVSDSWFPANGSRPGDTGTLSDVGVRGYYRSAAYSFANNLRFINNGGELAVETRDTGRRASAMGVRCVKE